MERFQRRELVMGPAMIAAQKAHEPQPKKERKPCCCRLLVLTITRNPHTGATNGRWVNTRYPAVALSNLMTVFS